MQPATKTQMQDHTKRVRLRSLAQRLAKKARHKVKCLFPDVHVCK